MAEHERTTVELPAWTVSRGQTYLNEKVHGEGREDLEPLRETVAQTTPSDGTVEFSRGEYRTFQRVVREGAERELKQLEGQEANLMGDAEQQREAARSARQGIVNNPPEFGESNSQQSRGGSAFRGPTTPTDIGRTGTGRFDRPDTDPDVDPAPVARDDRSGRFGLDPFDIGSSTVGTSADELFGGDASTTKGAEFLEQPDAVTEGDDPYRIGNAGSFNSPYESKDKDDKYS